MNPNFLYSTVLITYKVSEESSSVGTGFLVYREIESRRQHVFVITNKHVIPPEGEKKSISIRMTVKEGNEPAEIASIPIPVVGDDKFFLPHVKVHPDEDTDVAAINITDFKKQLPVMCALLPESIFGTKDKLQAEDITIGDEVFLLGYPQAIFDKRNVFPILRQGTIATVPKLGYSFNDAIREKYGLPKWIDGFLVDANVFPGSSGSLVILKPQAAIIPSPGRRIKSHAKKTPYLLGLVSKSIPIIDEDLKSVQRMGLGVVYSVETVLQVIDEFYKK